MPHEQFFLAHDLAVALTLDGSHDDAAALLSECIEEHLHPIYDATFPSWVDAPASARPPWYTFLAVLLADGCRSIVVGAPLHAAIFTREYLLGAPLPFQRSTRLSTALTRRIFASSKFR